MNVLFKYLRLLSLSASGALLLSIVFAANPYIAEGTITGKIFWFHFTVLLFAFSIFLMEATVRKSSFTFSLPDGLLLLLAGLILFTYDRILNPQPERLLFVCQLTMLWFMLRSVLQTHPELRIFYLSIIIFTGILEAILGIGQLYGDPDTPHPLFQETGLQFNTGPFSGYVAIVLPICLSYMLRFHDCNKTAWWEMRTHLFYLGVVGIIFTLIALPGGMSRPAWIAAGISGLWVFLLRKTGWKHLKQKLLTHVKITTVAGFVLFLLIVSLPVINEFIQPHKSAGRTLMWNVTTKAILDHPITGTGLGGFPVAYAKTQADYFSSGKASDTERISAGCPKFAFNDYLHLGLEFGITGLLLFTLWIGFCLYYGLKNKQIAATGGILALLFFAMYAYPLQLPSFWILLIFLGSICITVPRRLQKNSYISFPHIGMVTALTACFFFFEQRSYYDSYKEWNTLRKLKKENVNDVAAQGYRCLYPRLSHRTEFLLEGSECLRKTGQYADAIKWGNRGLQLSAEPEFYYIVADSYQKLGFYKQAEKYLLQCTYILPEKIDTYYLLSKLYAEPSFFQPNKFRLAACSVLSKKSVTHTKKNKQMRDEVKQLFKETFAVKK